MPGVSTYSVVQICGATSHPVGTVTCVMVFTAKIPHATSNKKSWFGYWKRDGFVKTKNLGRVDLYHNWESIRDRWIEMFRNREVHAGESVMQKISADDEWCVEAYMETDYTKITQADFEKTVQQYFVFKALSDHADPDSDEGEEESDEA